ncbi:MAG: hypothetical protein REH83_05380 [Rickettsiella sp.]|nr:hypothetical protein [Rickettsiella sp.]
MFQQSKLIYYIEIFWLSSLIIFASLIYLNQEYIGLFFNSDHLMFPAVFQDLFLNQGHFKDWSLSPAPHFFPDILIFLPAFFLTKDIFYQFLITLCLQLVFLYLSVKYFYSQFFPKKITIIFALASVSIFYLLTFKKPASLLLAAGPLIPAGHMGEFIVGIFVVSMQLKIITNDNFKLKNNFLLFGTALIFLCSLSDWLFFIQFALAILFTYLFLYINRIIKFKIVRHYAILPCVASITGVLLTKYTVPTDILLKYLSHPSLKKISLVTIHNQFSTLINLFKSDMNWFTSVQSILFYSGVFALFCICNKRNKENSILTMKLLFLSNFILFSVVFTIFFIFLLAQEAYVQDRYMYTIFYFPILIFFYFYALIIKKKLNNFLIFLAILVMLCLIFNILFSVNSPRFKIKTNYYPEYISCIDRALHGKKYSGIAYYSDANVISMLSKEKLQVVSVLSNLEEFPYAINRKKYKKSYTFAVVDVNPPVLSWKLDRELIEHINGKPEKKLICGNKEILIYKEDKLKIRA